MASETINKIKDAEDAAKKAIADANEKAGLLKDEANSKGKQKAKEIIEKAQADARKMISQSEADYELAMKNVENSRVGIKDELYSTAKANESKAKKVIKDIIIP